MKTQFLHNMHEKVNNLLSYGAILNFIIDNRDTGKSTQFKKRALRRMQKKHTMCVWCRRHKDEIKEAKREFLNNKFFAVLEKDYPNQYDKKDFKIEGNYATYKHKPFVYFCNVAKAKSDKGIDAENIDTIVFDEFMTEERKYKYYRGNEVHDFFTIFFTKKRTHADGSESNIYIFMLGNRESFSNPYYKYFDLPNIPLEYEGIKTFRNGSIAVMQLNNQTIKENSKYNKKLLNLIKDTPLDKFMNGNVLTEISKDFVECPKLAQIYAQFDFGYKLSFMYQNGFIYVKKGLDKKRNVFVNKPKDQYKRTYVVAKNDKLKFNVIRNMYKINHVKYDSARTYFEAMQIFAYIGLA